MIKLGKTSYKLPPEEAERPHFLYLLQENSNKLQVFSNVLQLFINIAYELHTNFGVKNTKYAILKGKRHYKY